MKFSQVLVAYFVIGAMMWGGGVIQWDQAGVGGLLAQPTNESVATNSSTGEDLTGLGGTSSSEFDLLIQVLDLLLKFVGFVFWPITTLQSVDAPVEVVVVGGGAFSMAFIASLIRFVWRKA